MFYVASEEIVQRRQRSNRWCRERRMRNQIGAAFAVSDWLAAYNGEVAGSFFELSIRGSPRCLGKKKPWGPVF
jgi:hypothetical protein